MDKWIFKEEFSEPIEGEIIYINQEEFEWLEEYIKDGEDDKTEGSLRKM